MLDNQSRLQELETVIERGLMTFVEVGSAIREIQESKLYRETHDTFEKYCRERWGWSRSRAYQMVEAANTVEILSTTVDIPNERQVRAIASVAKEDPDTARRIWGDVSAEHGLDATAQHIEKAKAEVKTARSIRNQLPPATKTVVEASDPDDTPLSRSPKQLTHLLDISNKHGDEIAAETAERVANGEFTNVFDAYSETKEDKEEQTADRFTVGEALEDRGETLPLPPKTMTAEQRRAFDLYTDLMKHLKSDPEEYRRVLPEGGKGSEEDALDAAIRFRTWLDRFIGDAKGDEGKTGKLSVIRGGSDVG